MKKIILFFVALGVFSSEVFAINPQRIFELNCASCHNGKLYPSAKQMHEQYAGKKSKLIIAFSKCGIAMALPKADRDALINWLSKSNSNQSR